MLSRSDLAYHLFSHNLRAKNGFDFYTFKWLKNKSNE